MHQNNKRLSNNVKLLGSFLFCCSVSQKLCNREKTGNGLLRDILAYRSFCRLKKWWYELPLNGLHSMWLLEPRNSLKTPSVEGKRKENQFNRCKKKLLINRFLFC